MNKLPQITLAFWIIKILATTLGESGGDLLAHEDGLNLGYAVSSTIVCGVLGVLLFCQLRAKSYIPFLYWGVILATSTGGTNMADFMSRSLHLGYAQASTVLIVLLCITLGVWWMLEKSLSVVDIRTVRAEVLYWVAILFSNTLGTALGDYLADDSGLGFLGSSLVIGGAILLTALLYRFTKIPRVLLFWLAFVLTRPFGATFGDLLTKEHEEGGLEFGTAGTSAVLLALLIVAIVIHFKKLKRASVPA